MSGTYQHKKVLGSGFPIGKRETELPSANPGTEQHQNLMDDGHSTVSLKQSVRYLSGPSVDEAG
jgi:hypothetical protein